MTQGEGEKLTKIKLKLIPLNQETRRMTNLKKKVNNVVGFAGWL